MPDDEWPGDEGEEEGMPVEETPPEETVAPEGTVIREGC